MRTLRKNGVGFGSLVIAALCLVSAASAQTLTNPAFPDNSREVWGHVVGYGKPDYNDLDNGPNYAPAYNSLYPTELVEGDYYATRRVNRIDRMKSAGLTGANILLLDGATGTELNGYLTDADTRSFKIAPCIQVTSEANAISIVTNYVTAASSHVSAAKMNGAYVIFTYGTKALTPTQWQNVRNALTSNGIQTYWVEQLYLDISQGGFQSSRATPYFPVFEAAYVFDDQSDTNWSNIIGMMNTNNESFAGGVLAGYNRTTSLTGGYIDAQLTGRLRNAWDQVLASGLHWNTAISWDDTTEHHEIRPTSDWNWTRADLNAYYGAILRGTGMPSRLANAANLYVTTPQWIKEGEEPFSEGLVINDTNNTLTVKIQLFKDGNTSLPFGSVYTSTVAPKSVGAVTSSTGILNVADRPTNRFLRARTQLLNGTTILQEIMSAPICVYQADFNMPHITWGNRRSRRLYYSLPGYKARSASSKPSLTITGNPLSPGASTTLNLPPSTPSVWHAEVLQNSVQVKNFFDNTSRTSSLPISSSASYNTTEAAGFYVARVIESNEKVSYSDPIYFAPPTNQLNNPNFEADAAAVQSPQQWLTSSPSGDADADYTSNGFGAKEGVYYGTHKKATAYDVTTYQTRTGLTNGLYTLSAWCKSSGGQTTAVMQATDYDVAASVSSANLVTTDSTGTGGTWRQIKLQNINVQNGQLTVKFHSQAAANQWIAFDNVQLYLQP